MANDILLDVPEGIDQYSGLFVCPTLTPYRVGRVNAFCIPSNIKVVSGPPPIRFRMVSYQIRYWKDGQPLLPNEYERSVIYRSSSTGQDTFTFTTDLKDRTIEQLLALICRHFCGTEVLGKQVRTYGDGFERFMMMNKATLTVSDSNISKIYHIQSIDRNPLFKLLDETLYATVDDSEFSKEAVYLDAKNLVNQIRDYM